MRNRALQSRINAKNPKKAKVVTGFQLTGKLAKVDPETGKVLKTWKTLSGAIKSEKLNRPNLIGAIKNGNKYKGHFWKEV